MQKVPSEMREVVLDTETTGLDPKDGHRLVEIGCVELFNHVATGTTWHQYVNPQRDVPHEAFEIHGLSAEFLSGFPTFDRIVDDFVAFIGDAQLVIHNAAFDLGFLNEELYRIGRSSISSDRVTDTVSMARKRFPGAPANLDALCRRFGIDNSIRDKHGALLDAELLAGVYLELRGGRQPGFDLGSAKAESAPKEDRPGSAIARPPRPHAPTNEELAAHEAFVATLKNPLWLESRPG